MNVPRKTGFVVTVHPGDGEARQRLFLMMLEVLT